MAATIYIVCKGERGEGHSPEAAYDTYLLAMAHVLRVVREPDVFVEREPGRWMMTVNGVDEWWVYRMIVESSVIVPAKPVRTHWIKPRGICSGCGAERSLRVDGSVQTHDAPRGPRSDRWSRGRYMGTCEGSGIPPKEEVP